MTEKELATIKELNIMVNKLILSAKFDDRNKFFQTVEEQSEKLKNLRKEVSLWP
jgi:hypothetical protein